MWNRSNTAIQPDALTSSNRLSNRFLTMRRWNEQEHSQDGRQTQAESH